MTTTTQLFIDRDALQAPFDKPPILAVYPDGSEGRGWSATWACRSRLVFDPFANHRAHAWVEVDGPVNLQNRKGDWNE
jgi:hypothetical protein